MTNGTEMTVSQYFANVSGDNRGPLFNPVPTSVIPEMFVARPAPSPAPGQMAGAEIDPASGAGVEAGGAGHQSVGYESLKCYIRRKKTGTFIKANKYEMFLEQGNRFLMSASKSSKASKSSNYIISADPNGAQRDGPDFLGKLRSNFVGTQFVLYDDGLNPKKVIAGSGRQVRVRREHAAVIYATNVMGTKGPRKMAVHVPKTHPDGSVEPFQPRTDAFSDPGSLVMQGGENARDNSPGPPSWQPASSEPAIEQTLSFSDELCNRPPRWMGGEVGAYVLNFEGRVTMASVKNFQLIRKTDLPAELSGQKRNNGNVLLQFGRVGKDRFNVDIRYPMTPFQAFGIILSSFDGKMACE
jgi:tubby-related protein 1